MKNHTPAPWIYQPKLSTDGEKIYRSYGFLIMAANHEIAIVENNEANARLITAAPELLESLKALVCLIEQSQGIAISKEGAVDVARAAIAKAEGK